MVLFLGKRKRADDGERDELTTQCDTIKQFKDALRSHDRAMKDLTSSLTACGKSLAALAASLKALSSNIANGTTVSACGALVSGLEELLCGAPMEQLKEEAEHSMKARFAAATTANHDADGARKRYTKSQDVLDGLRAQCEKLARKKESSDKEKEQFVAEDRKRVDQEGEVKRLRTEFGDAYRNYITVLGRCVTEDAKAMSTALHQVFSLWSYQFRKCHEHIKLLDSES